MNKREDFAPDTSWRTDGSAYASAEAGGCGCGGGCGSCGSCSSCGSCASCSCATDADYVTSLDPITEVPAENYQLGFVGSPAHVGSTSFGAYSDGGDALVVGNTVVANTVVTYDGHGDARVYSAATGDNLNVTVNTGNQTITITEVKVGGG